MGSGEKERFVAKKFYFLFAKFYAYCCKPNKGIDDRKAGCFLTRLLSI